MIKLPITTDSAIRKFLHENSAAVLENLVETIAEEMDKDVPTFPIRLWQFGDSNYYGGIASEHCAMALTDAMKYFVKEEMYEKAAECRDLILKVALADVMKYEG